MGITWKEIDCPLKLTGQDSTMKYKHMCEGSVPMPGRNDYLKIGEE